MKKILECVPNFSEGRELAKIEKFVAPFRAKDGVKLLDYQNDEDHNRAVVTVVGEPEPLKAAVIESMGVAVEVIDMRRHQGQHPRMGAIDVVPFIPVKNISLEEAVDISKDVAAEAAARFNLPIYLYEKSASTPERQNLAAVRKGQFEGLAQKITRPEWKPDFGPAQIHPSAGVTAVGVRMPLVAYNVNLDTNNFDIADKIAKQVRHISGGLRYCKAIGIELKDRGIVQVSMNMTDYTKTALYRVFELIKIESSAWSPWKP
jgi:glutamate formiminotransferase